MASAEDRMSSSVVLADWLPPDDRDRTLLLDYEQGPVALNDTSEGIDYQEWTLTYDAGGTRFLVTPEIGGIPVEALTGVAGVTQCSFCFDQNGHVNISYTLLTGATYLYWYDTLLGDWTTTTLPSYVFCPTLTMDDKRDFATSYNDIILWWTSKQGDDTYDLYRALQSDRFDPLVPKLMDEDVYPYIYKLGMHKGLRIQIGLSDRIL